MTIFGYNKYILKLCHEKVVLLGFASHEDLNMAIFFYPWLAFYVDFFLLFVRRVQTDGLSPFSSQQQPFPFLYHSKGKISPLLFFV